MDRLENLFVCVIEMAMAFIKVDFGILTVRNPTHHGNQTDDDELFHGV